MELPISTRYAIRSLARHPRRSALSVLGVGVGCAVCMGVVSFVGGESRTMLEAVAQSGSGHIRVVPPGWQDTRENDLRLTDWELLLSTLRRRPDLVVATPRSRTDGLLGFGTRQAAVEVVGVDPATEQAANRLVRDVAEGQYLRADEPGTTVIGAGVARRLDAELDDDLMITAAGKSGDIVSAMLRVVGIVATGSSELDTTICHVNLSDIAGLSGHAGVAELTAVLSSPQETHRVAQELRLALPGDSEVLTWEQILPELASGVEVDKTWSRMIVTIIMLVVFLGIASSQLSAVLERRREFAVLAALGMKGGRLVQIMLAESLVLGLLGSVLAMGFGLPSTYWIATKGIDFGKLYGSDLSISNILIDPVFRGSFGWWLVPLALCLSLVATSLSSIYPAWYATHTDPATALRVDH